MSTKHLPANAGTALDQMCMTVLESSLTADLDPKEMAEIRELFRQVMGTIVVLFDALSPPSTRSRSSTNLSCRQWVRQSPLYHLEDFITV